MADFSKEYGEDFNDFSIKDEFNKLEPGYYQSIICEGFGFLAILNNNGQCCVAMPKKGDLDNYDWRAFCFTTNTIGDVVQTD